MTTATIQIHPDAARTGQVLEGSVTLITFASEKGGVVKTGGTAHLGRGLALAGHRVLLIDSDPQGNLATALGQRPTDALSKYLIGHPAQTVQIAPGLHLLPGDQATTRTATFVESSIRAGDMQPHCIRDLYLDLAKALNAAYIIIDTQPTPNWWVEQQYMAAHIAVIPTSMDNIEISAINTTKAKLDQLNPACLTRILPSIFYAGRSLDTENLALLRTTYGEIILDPIPAAAAVRSARSYGQTIFDYKPRHPAAQAYWKLVNHILALTGQPEYTPAETFTGK